MSSASYPTGMRPNSTSGYNQKSANQLKYISWKGSGILSNPIGITSGNIRPFTNNDLNNTFSTGFGLPRPIKHYRKGRAMIHADDILNDANINRTVKSSTGQNLLSQINTPGSVIIKSADTNNDTNNTCEELHCNGNKIISSYYPNNTFVTNNPTDDATQTSELCCNAEKKAFLRTLPANTNLKKTYFTTHHQYMQNRCNTFKQKSFNYPSTNINLPPTVYLGNCSSNCSCRQLIYKPNNRQFAQQGAVTSSTYLLKQQVNTIQKNLNSFDYINGQKITSADIYQGNNSNIPFIYKNKSTTCNNPPIIRFQNKNACKNM
jgi:hypothetical protein